MGNEIKLLITSDLHLGLKNAPVSIDMRLRTFQRILSLACEHNLLCIVGDFIDRSGADEYLLQYIDTEFNKLKERGVEIVYCEGNEELSLKKNLAEQLRTIKVDHYFGSPCDSKPYHYVKEESHLYLYGAPASIGKDLHTIHKNGEEGFHLGLFYVDFNSDALIPPLETPTDNINRMKREDIKSIGLDFYLFGSNHAFKMFKVQDAIIAAYPGSPEATTHSETGDRYVLSVVVDNNKMQSIKRVAVNSITLSEISVDCALYQSQDPILSLISSNKSKYVNLTVTLKGNRSFIINYDLFKALAFEFYYLRFEDHSLPSLEMIFSEYGYEESIRGDVVRIIKEKIQKNDIPEDISMDDVTRIINHMVSSSSESLEDWLCSM